MSSFNRPNLRYIVLSKKGKNSTEEIIDLIKRSYRNDCGIVYCLSRKDCDSIASTMKSNGIKALSYHAGLSDHQRIDIQGKWISEQVLKMLFCIQKYKNLKIDKIKKISVVKNIIFNNSVSLVVFIKSLDIFVFHKN